MGINWAEHTVEIDAPIETCFDAIVDYESFPGWQSAVERVEVESRDPDGLGKRVTLYVSAKGQRVNYTLDYSYDRPREISWDFAGGNGVKDVDGDYRFESLGETRTRATYKLGIDPSLPVPGIVARRIHSQALKKSVEELKAEAERRHREQPSATQPEAPPPPARRAVTPPAAPTEEPGETADPEPAPGETADPEPALGAATSLPQTGLEQAASLGREVAGGTVRAGLNLAGGAFAVARGAAAAGVEIARGVAGAVVDRASGARGRRPR